MKRIFAITTIAIPLAVAAPVFAAGSNMQKGSPHAIAVATDYHFELSGLPKSTSSGKNIVSVKLVHDGKPVPGAIIIQSRADMGPIGMSGMTAPIKPLGEGPPGTYRFEVENGSVWKKADNWALSFGAKVQGVAQTVTGSVTVRLAP